MTLTDDIGTAVLSGLAGSPGLAYGYAFIHYEKLGKVRMETIHASGVQNELKRLDNAISRSKQELEALRVEASNSVGNELSRIFDAQMMILEDDDFLDKVRQSLVARPRNVEWVFQQEVNKTVRALARSKDKYMREMISDINAVTARLLHNLSGIDSIGQRMPKSPVIAFAPFFSPDEIMSMKDSNVTGFVAETGGPTSHMALFARALGLPAVIGVKNALRTIKPSQQVLLNGALGEVIISPSKKEWNSFKKRVETSRRQARQRLAKLSDIPSRTKDGRNVCVTANLEVPSDYDRALADEDIGVGLYRTEFLYLNRGDFPEEEEQFETYRKIAEEFNPNPVTLRTFDLGGDKFTQHFKNNGEPNPALGWRAIRFSLDVPRIFRSQLRAMLRASAYGNIRIMLPMISSVEQIVRAKRIITSVKKDLRRRKIEYDDGVQVGIMIEIPSAAIMAHRLALEADFFSIGTNDLTQYTLAVDRNHTKVAKWYREYHPAVLRFISHTVQAGHDNDIPVSICGELAGDPRACKMLVGFGVDSLSMSPNAIHTVKALIPTFTYEEAKEFAQKILTMQSAVEVENLVNEDYEANS